LDENDSNARPLAGGTDVLVQMRGNRFQFDVMVDIKNIPELNRLSCSEKDGLILGAAVPCYKVYEDPTVARLYPGLADAAFLIGGIQIQGRASIGGNLCNSAPSADTVPALIALGAICEIVGPRGRRSVLVEDFCTAPGKNILAAGELLVSLKLPPPNPNAGSSFLRFIPRNEMDIAVVGVGVYVELDDDLKQIRSARIALGAVAPTPVLAREAGKLLAGKQASDPAIAEASEAARTAARPIDDMRGTIRQRMHLVGVLTQRALRTSIVRAQVGEQK
jgi:CO/xanthine dehydrogenase FAD-binding subunit